MSRQNGLTCRAGATQAALFNATAGFVRTEAVVVTRGPYAPVLLDVRADCLALP